MDRPQQIIRQINVLLDKPISQFTIRQLHKLVLNDANPVDKCVHILCQKRRLDIILFIVREVGVSTALLLKVLEQIFKHVMEFKKDEVEKFYLALLPMLEQKQALEKAYCVPAKQIVRKPNLQEKEAFLHIIQNNLQYFYRTSCKGSVVAIADNFLNIFLTFLLMVPASLSLLCSILRIDHASKGILRSSDPQLEEVYLDLSASKLSQIQKQVLTILEKTNNKINQYALHRGCFQCLALIAQILTEYQIQESDLYFRQADVGEIIRCAEHFSGRKGIQDEDRKCKKEWSKKGEQIRKGRKAKGEKVNKTKTELDIPLIEDVIETTNNYLKKKQLSPASSRSVSPTKHYLKKGKGLGGGRTYLLPHQREPLCLPVDPMVQSCFQSYEKALTREFKPIISQDFPQIKQNQFQSGRQSIQKTNTVSNFPVQQLPNQSSINNSSLFLSGSQLQEDVEVQEISNLIDLAYNYKFS